MQSLIQVFGISEIIFLILLHFEPNQHFQSFWKKKEGIWGFNIKIRDMLYLNSAKNTLLSEENLSQPEGDKA